MTRQSRAYLYGLGAVLAWSTVATAFKISLQHLSPAQLVLSANLFSLLALLGILCWQRRLGEFLNSLFRSWSKSLLFGAINPCVYYLVLFQSYVLLPAQEAQAINYTWALTMTLLSVPLLHQALRQKDIVAAVICYIGVLVIGTRGQLLSLSFSNVDGVLLALFSTLLWAVYWIFNTMDRREEILGLALNFTYSLPLILGWCAWRGELHPVPWQGIAAGAYVGVFEMGITFVLWLSAMKLTESTARIANMIFLSPIVSLILIHYIVGEPVYNSTLIGLASILGGLVIQKLPWGERVVWKPRHFKQEVN